MESSFTEFVRVLFPSVYGLAFHFSRHHRLLIKTLELVYTKKIKRLIVNMPPGYSKTELVVILFSAWCMAKNPKCRFMHTSYSDDLALGNSSKVRDVLQSELFSLLWPMKIRTDSQAKKMWTIAEHGGHFIAVPMSGQVTGRRAGVLASREFSGALVIDDPQKPEDALSASQRVKINRKFKNTVRNRVADENVAIIVVMQRLHKVDLTGFLLGGGTGEKWHHLTMPAEIPTCDTMPIEYDREWTHGTPIRYTFDAGPLWVMKHNDLDLHKIKTSDPFVWNAQYLQKPTAPGLSMFHEDWWRFYSSYSAKDGAVRLSDGTHAPLSHKSIYADTAMKTGQANDFSVIQCWGKLRENKIVLLDQVRGKWEAPELEQVVLAFVQKHQYKAGETAVGLRGVYIEDKASGIGLIQTISRNPLLSGLVWPIPRDKDKVSRAKSCTPSIARGEVLLPENADWINVYLDEFNAFNEFMTHEHDDQIDPTLDAINDLLMSTPLDYAAFV